MVRKLKPLRFLLKMALALAIFFLLACKLILIDVPDVNLFVSDNPTFTSYMNDDDKLDETAHKNGIDFVALANISPALIRAVLAAEDDTFFEHHGFNWQSIQTALIKNLKKKKYARGGSTITQQLARNLFLNRNKSLWRKLRETLITWQIEQSLSKERILELYLNTAEFGPGIYGVSIGARYHFTTTPKNLNNSQASLMAALLPNPKLLGKKPYPSYTYQRQQKILGLMGNIAWPAKEGVVKTKIVKNDKIKSKSFFKTWLSLLDFKSPPAKKKVASATETNLPTTVIDAVQTQQIAETEEKNDLSELDQKLPEEVFVDE